MGHPTLLVSLSLLLLLFSFFSTSSADDGPAILKLAAALNPAPSSWSTTSSSGFCKWQGISCDSSSHVTTIDLSSKSLSGLVPSFSSFASLQRLFLNNNNFSSVSAGAFDGLSNLQLLSLSDNDGIEPWLLPDLTQSTGLTNLALDNTNIYGPLPDVFQTLSSLQLVRLSYNNITGPLPASLAGASIQYLWLNNQKSGFTGTIDILSQMTSLTQVWIHKNQFTGPIPDLSKCTSLFDLQLRDNLLTGPVPQSLISLPSLKNVSLSNNKLQGPLPQFPPNVEKVSINGTNNFCLNTVGPCDPQVTIMLAIAGGFGYPVSLSDSWTGNNACQFSFVTCDAQRNVITVNLAKKSLFGTISPAFGNLTSLKNLNLNDNNLTGPIPDSLTKLSSLQLVDVSNNNITGKIPTFPNTVRFQYTGNALLGKSTGSGGGGSTGGLGGSGKSSVGVIMGIVIGVLIFLAVLGFVSFKFIMKKYGKFGRAQDKENQTGEGKPSVINMKGRTAYEMQSQYSGDGSDRNVFDGGNAIISIEVLRQVTNNFSEENILGRGGFGVVYKGELHDGTKIAVKRMESSNVGNKVMNEFKAEIAVLSKVRHRHLVALLGYCINGNERLLVYEYMPQGTLGQHLFEWRQCGYSPLTWKQRVTIALDVARGVEYLHSLAQQSFIHRDLKSSNILLGDDMRAKVADFGLVKHAPDGKYSVETRLAGTFGYLAPEYATTGRVTTKVDVYAFGVVLMELITGRKALDDTLPDEQSHLVTWFRRVLMNKDNILTAVDQTLKPVDESLASILMVAELAGHCTARDPHQRPDMGHAVNVLAPLVQEWRPTRQQDEDQYGIDLDMSLPQALQRWQADEGTSTMYGDMSHSQIQSSIASKPEGFKDTFSSSDARW
ncbi:hypothetical protein SLE2022_152710 [Rubroshorea leprosula]